MTLHEISQLGGGHCAHLQRLACYRVLYSSCLHDRCHHYELQHNLNISQYARSNSTDVTDMHISLSSDTTTNIAFGLFMAVLGLVAVYQGARYAARHIGQ